MKKLLIVVLSVSMSLSALAQTEKQPKVIESERIMGTNPTVGKLKEATNDKKKAELKDDKAKQGPVYGSEYCDVVVDNYTNLYIKVWVDDEYKGVVGPYGKITVAALPGKTTLYARADFDDGSYYYWNPSAFDCSWQYTWRLR